MFELERVESSMEFLGLGLLEGIAGAEAEAQAMAAAAVALLINRMVLVHCVEEGSLQQAAMVVTGMVALAVGLVYSIFEVLVEEPAGAGILHSLLAHDLGVRIDMKAVLVS